MMRISVGNRRKDLSSVFVFCLLSSPPDLPMATDVPLHRSSEDVTPSTMDTLQYEICMDAAEKRVLQLLESSAWQLEREKEHIRIWKIRCDITDNTIFRCECILKNRSPLEIAALIHPEGDHRTIWDTQLASIQVLDRISSDTVVIRHHTKPRFMSLVSARDTIDLCRFSTDPAEGTRTVVMTSVTHERGPRVAGIVRAHTHPSVFIISARASDCLLTAVLHAEMHLLSIPSAILDSLVPKGILRFFDDLRKYALKNNDELKLDLRRPLTGWNVGGEVP